jgi:hypothetical protein
VGTTITVQRINGETIDRAVERHLREICGPHGTIKGVTVIRDHAVGGSAGIVIADMETSSEVNEVMRRLDGLPFGGGVLFYYRELQPGIPAC